MFHSCVCIEPDAAPALSVSLSPTDWRAAKLETHVEKSQFSLSVAGNWLSLSHFQPTLQTADSSRKATPSAPWSSFREPRAFSLVLNVFSVQGFQCWAAETNIRIANR